MANNDADDHGSDDDDDWDASFDTEIGTAVREEATMLRAPRHLFRQIDAVSVGGLIHELHENGVARMNNLLTVPQTSALLAYVNQQLAVSLAEVALMGSDQKDELFSNVKAGEHRWDLKLPFSAIVQDTLTALLQVDSLLGDVLLGLVSC